MPTKWAARGLVPWDIDQTLLSFGGLVYETYRTVFRRVHGAEPQVMPDVHGRTDHAITLELLKLHRLPHEDADVTAFLDVLVQVFRTDLPRTGAAALLLPGAKEALHTLGEWPIVQSVVTGNVRAVAELKVRQFGLDAWLDLTVGGYGDRTGRRADLVAAAIGVAQQRYGRTVARRTVVIGDTPYDIEAAVAHGVTAVGVTSGAYAAAQLSEAGADLTLASLHDLAPVLALLAGSA
ncbi:HAD hydrolase-like protein [Micromonospora tulbaghiae]|uniref:HAD family hydrolase n=1 Tax=Micromonospora tulbaghiae TaxID=479978 RepID=UPI0033D17036